MTKALTYVELDVPDLRCISHLAFDVSVADIVAGSALLIDDNAAGTVRGWQDHGGTAFEINNNGFGSSYLHVDSTGWIATPDTPDLTFGSGDFSIELYFWKDTGTGSENNVCGQRAGIGGANTTRSFNIDFDASGHARGLVFQGSTQIAATGTTVFGVSTSFHHVSFERLGSNLLLFVDGVLEATTAITGAINDSTGALAIGQDGEDTANRYDGWIDEFTICKYAQRAVNFVPEPLNAPDFTPRLLPPLRTLRFVIDSSYLPKDIDAIPSLISLKVDPAIISLGEDLGQRATVTATFRDHRHIFDGEVFASGTFWGKFRAFYGLRLRGFPFRIINGALGQALAAMETRHFAVESTDGPSPKGEFKIVAKDILKFADADRSQAPVLSNGFLSANISSGATSATLSPAGIGTGEYSASGLVAIGGSEICAFTRSGDVLTLTARGIVGTAAVSHNAQDRVQLVLEFSGEDPAIIIRDLLVFYADVPASYINLANWQAEIAAYLNTVYTAVIAEPTSVSTLLSELIEQVGLALWWDDVTEQIKLQVLRPIAAAADVFSAEEYMADSLAVTEQSEKRLTEVYTYFAKINPLVPADQENNYRSTAFTTDFQAEVSYGSAAIKKIFSRWIPAGGRAVATTLNDILLARFRDPPRRISFNLLRGAGNPPLIGIGYQISGWPFQNKDGSAAIVPAQITRLNPRADIFEVEVEELSANFTDVGGSPGVHVIIIDANISNVVLRDMHDSIYGTPISGNEVRCTINAGVIVGSSSAGGLAFNVGTWPGGVAVTLTVNGRIEGIGGLGGTGCGSAISTGGVGQAGGTALFTRKAITLVSASGAIWGGGGGGGGGGSAGNVGGNNPLVGGNGGSGGAGVNPGAGQLGGGGANLGLTGNSGTDVAGGVSPATRYGEGVGGNGGGPGLAGAAGGAGTTPIHTNGGSGGAAGTSIDGISFVTTLGGAGDRRGPQIN